MARGQKSGVLPVRNEPTLHHSEKNHVALGSLEKIIFPFCMSPCLPRLEVPLRIPGEGAQVF